jgi:hypothetical protein
MTATPAPAVPAPADGERFARQVVTWCGVLVGLACFGFSFGNTLALGRYLRVPWYVAWLVAPAVDLTVFGLIVGIRHLSLRGLEGRRLRPARLLLVAAGLAALALNTAHGLFVRRHLGVVAYDSLAPLLLIGWAEVGPWFLRQFAIAAAASSASARAGRSAGPATARTARPAAPTGLAPLDPAHLDGGRPTPGPRPDGLAANARAATTVTTDPSLLERARALNTAHWRTHGRQISRDKLRAALGIGASRAERLLAALAADPPASSPPGTPTPTPARAAGAAQADQWAPLKAVAGGRPGGPQQDGTHG